MQESFMKRTSVFKYNLALQNQPDVLRQTKLIYSFTASVCLQYVFVFHLNKTFTVTSVIGITSSQKQNKNVRKKHFILEFHKAHQVASSSMLLKLKR